MIRFNLSQALLAFSAWTILGSPLGSFKAWRATRPEIKTLQFFVRREPLRALEYSSPLSHGSIYGDFEDADVAMTNRQGKVLTPWSLLLEHFLVKLPLVQLFRYSGTEHVLEGGECVSAPSLPAVVCVAVFPIASFAVPAADDLARILGEVLHAGVDSLVHVLDARDELVRSKVLFCALLSCDASVSLR
jgi:hypothetical protein